MRLISVFSTGSDKNDTQRNIRIIHNKRERFSVKADTDYVGVGQSSGSKTITQPSLTEMVIMCLDNFNFDLF